MSAADFMSSPFMAAVLADGALPKFEGRLIANQAKKDSEELRTRYWRAAEMAYHRLGVAHGEALDARLQNRQSRLQRNAEEHAAAAALIEAIEVWVAAGFSHKDAVGQFKRAVANWRIMALCKWQLWDERKPGWLAKAEAATAAMARPKKSREAQA